MTQDPIPPESELNAVSSSRMYWVTAIQDGGVEARGREMQSTRDFYAAEDASYTTTCRGCSLAISAGALEKALLFKALQTGPV